VKGVAASALTGDFLQLIFDWFYIMPNIFDSSLFNSVFLSSGLEDSIQIIESGIPRTIRAIITRGTANKLSLNSRQNDPQIMAYDVKIRVSISDVPDVKINGTKFRLKKRAGDTATTDMVVGAILASDNASFKLGLL
jgi:hypothetical protein